MFDYVCILAALYLAHKTAGHQKLAAGIVAAEFIGHRVAYIVGIQLTELFEYSILYLVYALIETIALYLLVQIKSQIAILTLIFISISYNMLTVSQYAFQTFDFYSYYQYVMGAVMIGELIWLAAIAGFLQHDTNTNKQPGSNCANDSISLICVRGRNGHRSLL